jgi:hypothetical protein
MSDLSNEKILDILKTKGKLEAIKYVQDTLKVDLQEAKTLVEDVIAKNPGKPVSKENNLKNYISLAIVIAVIWVGCKMCGGDDKKEDKVMTHRERIEKLFSAWDGSQPAVEKWIKENINDPDSYKHVETRFIDNTKEVSVITTFTATNAFGGRVKNTCIAHIDTLGTLLSAQFEP